MFNFSVLMSVYSKEEPDNLKQAIDSIIAQQTVKPAEVVLIKDGPLTDSLEQMIDKLVQSYSRLKVYQLKENVGLGRALNYGVQKCNFDWIARMDTDDISAPDRFEKQIDFIKKNPNVDVVGSDIAEFNKSIEDIVSVKKMPRTHDEIKEMSKRRNPMCHMTIFMRKEKVIAAGNYLPLAYVEDYYLWIRMIFEGAKFHNLSEKLVYARVGNGMFGRRSNVSQISSWKVINEYLYSKKLITKLEYLLNMASIVGFVFMPVSLKKFVYKNILRK